jgi:O-methyltransferase
MSTNTALSTETKPVQLYLDLLKGCLTRLLHPDCHVSLEMLPTGEFSAEDRREGKDWPSQAETMIGLHRLDNIELCVTDVVERGIPGDLVETGVWRGGAVIFMRAILKALGDRDRVVWAVDSFEGLPKPGSSNHTADAADTLSEFNAYLGVSLDQVKSNFARYGLLDDQVQFVKGWFRDSLPSVPIHQIAVLRLDGDMYESTMDVLENLYSKVSVGGYVIVDDYGVYESCREAIRDFRNKYHIEDEIKTIDWSGVYWKRSR